MLSVQKHLNPVNPNKCTGLFTTPPQLISTSQVDYQHHIYGVLMKGPPNAPKHASLISVLSVL